MALINKIEMPCEFCGGPGVAYVINGHVSKPHLCDNCWRDTLKNMPDSAVFAAARGNGKSNMAMELWRIKLGIPDDEWEEMKREVKKEMFGEEES